MSVDGELGASCGRSSDGRFWKEGLKPELEDFIGICFEQYSLQSPSSAMNDLASSDVSF